MNDSVAPRKKRVLVYCQHSLGLGHAVRSMEIVRALGSFEVRFMNGGEALPEFVVPPGIDVRQLPPIVADAEFGGLQGRTASTRLDELFSRRRATLLGELDAFDPDILLIELFPLGRKRFAVELLPLLARVRLDGRRAKVACSLRDILVSRDDQERHDKRACDTLNRYFDLVLVHSDPRFHRLGETFGLETELRCRVEHTGFVARSRNHSEPPEESDRSLSEDDAEGESREPLVVASIGGGRVGHELLRCTIEASAELGNRCRILAFVGPYCPEEDYVRLDALAATQPYVELRRVARDFSHHLRRAALSVSMAGYNTCMDVLSAGVAAVVSPFTGGGDDEQTIRAEKLAALGACRVVHGNELTPKRLAAEMVEALAAGPSKVALDLRGAERTGEILGDLAGCCGGVAPRPLAPRRAHESTVRAALRGALASIEANDREIDVFLRDDDADDDIEPLRTLLDLVMAHDVPINLAVIPGTLTAAGARSLIERQRVHGRLFEVHQHGWRHVNHEGDGRKCEFGSARDFDAQIDDIRRGKCRLESTFGRGFFPAFTPPWNRCTEDTLSVLEETGFRVFSKDSSGPALEGRGFEEISISLDLFRWRGGARLRAPTELLEDLSQQLLGGGPVGILLHHKVMDSEAFAFVDALLGELLEQPRIRFRTFAELLSRRQEGAAHV